VGAHDEKTTSASAQSLHVPLPEPAPNATVQPQDASSQQQPATSSTCPAPVPLRRVTSKRSCPHYFVAGADDQGGQTGGTPEKKQRVSNSDHCNESSTKEARKARQDVQQSNAEPREGEDGLTAEESSTAGKRGKALFKGEVISIWKKFQYCQDLTALFVCSFAGAVLLTYVHT
jgi:hypothetical protein